MNRNRPKKIKEEDPGAVFKNHPDYPYIEAQYDKYFGGGMAWGIGKKGLAQISYIYGVSKIKIFIKNIRLILRHIGRMLWRKRRK